MQSQTNPTLPNPAKRSFLSFVLVPAVVLALLIGGSYVGIRWMRTGDAGMLAVAEGGCPASDRHRAPGSTFTPAMTARSRARVAPC